MKNQKWNKKIILLSLLTSILAISPIALYSCAKPNVDTQTEDKVDKNKDSSLSLSLSIR
ncbi:hypothetical protein [Mycoplasma miroungirhinis]|uniref:Variable surface lipoprotein n=1 Tax=Mycoplasma miroungirhinis TaxID=754516 RepID=A0A6M4JCM8_9MOLU|nr:hypothetical protein [Mycoplasma miroungirhinis]QJR44105.1 hypothetical protein HLA92_01495 [Mycoplasma miroungirhinis]